MKYLKFFEEFTNNKEEFPSLNKVYLATKRSSGQKWLSYKDFAGDKFFIQVTENNINKIDINPNYPILNYHSDIINELLDLNLIREDNIYNHPKHMKLSGSKKEFHNLVGEDENIPKTVYSKSDAKKNLKFPIIAKPAIGHSGIGIKVIKRSEEIDSLDESKFDVFSEFIDKSEEMRFFMFKGSPIFWMERIPLNDKAKSGGGKDKDKMSFSYISKNVKKIPNEYKTVLEKFSKIYESCPYICFDMMKDINDKIYVIESNLQPGVPFDSTVKIYKEIYEDFYKKSLDQKSNNKLKEYSSYLIEETLKKDKNRFFVKD